MSNLLIEIKDHYVVECTYSLQNYFFQKNHPYVIVKKDNQFFISDDLGEESLIDFNPKRKIELKLSEGYYYEFKFSDFYKLDCATRKLIKIE